MTDQQIGNALLALVSTGMLAYGLYSGRILSGNWGSDRRIHRVESPALYWLSMAFTALLLCVTAAGALGFELFDVKRLPAHTVGYRPPHTVSDVPVPEHAPAATRD